MNVKQKILDFFTLVFPSTWTEFSLFLIFFTIYGILGSDIALHYRIIFDDRIPWDAYFSFDNRAIVMTGGGFERHPLTYYFFNWIREFAFLFSQGKKDENFRLVLAFCSNLMVSLGCLQVFKYLKNIIRVPLSISIFLLFFYGFFSTNIMLSFTPETYAYSLFLLSLYHYYAATKIKKNQPIPTAALTLAVVSIGGMTTTNFIKVYLPLLFEKNLFWNFKKLAKRIFGVFISLSVFIFLFLYRISFDYQIFLNKTHEEFGKNTKLKATPIWEMIYSWFFGGNILFSSFITKDYNKKGFHYEALFMDVYSSFYQYLFVALVFGLIFWSWIRNFKNSLVQLLMLSFLVDFIIHCVLKFGLNCAYIYGGHFVFIIPLMLGWLFFSYQNHPKMLSFLYVFMALLFIYLSMNNTIRMEEFFQYLENYYR